MKNLVYLLVAVLMFSTSCTAQQSDKSFKDPIKILVYSRTQGFRHASIEAGISMLKSQSKKQNWIITATEDDKLFTENFLKQFDVAVFLNPTGDAINDAGQAAFENFINSGKGFVGIHAAADCEYKWPLYGNLVGAYFRTHPPAQKATVVFENFDHPAMIPFRGKKSYTTVDEWYSYQKSPRPNVHVLARLDENSIQKSNNDDWKMGDHPLIWWNDKNGVRSFYTVFGHTNKAFQDKLIIEHISNAINWAAKRID